VWQILLARSGLIGNDESDWQNGMAKRTSLILQIQIPMIGHETIAEQPEGVAVLGTAQGDEKGFAIVVLGENVAAMKGMVDLALVDGSW
jgi:hypothetical protein